MSHTILRNTSAAQNAPTTPIGKSSVSEPKLSDTEHVELSDFLSSGPETSRHEDVMQLARVGDIQGIKKLYSNGSFNSSYCDEEGITPLHVEYLPFYSNHSLTFPSGLLSTINMRCVNF